jgi:alkylation response protein AidB-like acyl-CoA dehydrogenase
MTVTSASPISNTSEDAQLLDTIERWTMRELKPIVREYDHEDRYPTTVVEQMKELGLFGATVSEEYGLAGADAELSDLIVPQLTVRVAEITAPPPVDAFAKLEHDGVVAGVRARRRHRDGVIARPRRRPSFLSGD